MPTLVGMDLVPTKVGIYQGTSGALKSSSLIGRTPPPSGTASVQTGVGGVGFMHAAARVPTKVGIYQRVRQFAGANCSRVHTP